MKHLPNIITALRIVGSIDLLFCNVAGWQFWTLYVFCGISDMIDGWFARKLQAESKNGSILDSMDGAHAGKFLANLQNEINRLA